jgi:NSS family neurotransmitter:Na+ symporter
MIELATRVLADMGMTRSRAITVVAIAGFALGIPSALNQSVFGNQDFVWGVGLMVSGLFFAAAVLRYGVKKFRMQLVNTEDSDIHIGVWWEWAIRLVVVQAVVLIAWWFYYAIGQDRWGPEGWANMALQWSLAIAFFIGINSWLVRMTNPDVERDTSPDEGKVIAIP